MSNRKLSTVVSSALAGASGYSGAAGHSGHSGHSGHGGHSGYSGSSGHGGHSGQSGASGTAGIIGVDGASGYSGLSGHSGVSGLSGVAGATGATGSAGEPGISGFSGAAGATGTSGFSGNSGTSGSAGAAGASGASGTSGAVGPAGTSGYSGTAPANVLTTSNYSSYALPLSGGTITGNQTINGSLTVGNGASSDIYMGDSDEGTRRIHCNSNRIGFLNQSNGWGSYCNDDGSFSTDVRFYGPWDSSGRNYSREWIEMPNHSGLYSALNNAHFYPNNASYGSWRIAGSRNGWVGLEFDNGGGQVTLMMNDNNYGFHRNNQGWRFYVTDGSLYVPGNITAYWSDERFKTNLVQINRESIDILSKFRAFRFNWNEKVKEYELPIEVGKEEIGLIAQHVQRVLPDAVVVNKSANRPQLDGTQIERDYLTINYDKITPLLVEATNVHEEEIQNLKKQIAELVSRINQLENKK